MISDLIKKLTRLANNNPNENEANLAARKVCRMLAECNWGEEKKPSIGEKVGRTWNDVKRSEEPMWRSSPFTSDSSNWSGFRYTSDSTKAYTRAAEEQRKRAADEYERRADEEREQREKEETRRRQQTEQYYQYYYKSRGKQISCFLCGTQMSTLWIDHPMGHMCGKCYRERGGKEANT